MRVLGHEFWADSISYAVFSRSHGELWFCGACGFGFVEESPFG